MRLIISSILSVILIACSSSYLKTGKNPLSFSNFQNLKVGLSTQSEVESKIGFPSKKELVENFERWSYEANGYQRLTLTFSKTGVLNSSLWLPLTEENESNLTTVKNIFSNGKFKEIQNVSHNPHAFPTSSTSLVDYNLGISLLVEDGSVQSIAFFDPKVARETASQPKSALAIPIVIGN